MELITLFNENEILTSISRIKFKHRIFEGLLKDLSFENGI